MQKNILRGNETALGIINGIQIVGADPQRPDSASPAIFGNVPLPVEPGVAYENNTASHQNRTQREDIDGSLPHIINSETEAGSCDRKEDRYNGTQDECHEVSLHLVSLCSRMSLFFSIITCSKDVFLNENTLIPT